MSNRIRIKQMPKHLSPSHYQGVMCALCGAILEGDDCCPGDLHGYREQEWNDYSRRHYPKHPCFGGVLPR